MGIIKRGILGGFSNKVANVVGTSWKGRAVIKSLPLSVANPRTTPQVNQRTKFGDASKFFSVILGAFVKPLWDRFSGDISGYNAVMKENVELFSNSGVPDWANLIMSKGRMDAPVLSAMSADQSLDVVAFTVGIPSDPTWGQAQESLFLAIYDQTANELMLANNLPVDPNTSEPFSLNGLGIITGHVYRVYASLKRADGTQVSNSATLSATAVA